MSKHAQNPLFEQFNYSTLKIQSFYSGSGLGLSISPKLCHLCSGDIDASSWEGEENTLGCFFCDWCSEEVFSLIRLPLALKLRTYVRKCKIFAVM